MGEHSLLRQHLDMGIRSAKKDTANKKSGLWMIFELVHTQFKKWRMAGQYVDKDDLMSEFPYHLTHRVKILTNQREEQGGLGELNTKILLAAERRVASHLRSQKARDSTVVQMSKLFKASFLKPQRLIHLSEEQEKERLLETWQFWDVVLYLAAFAELKELENHVCEPEKFRKM